jgi:hypothetical protein
MKRMAMATIWGSSPALSSSNHRSLLLAVATRICRILLQLRIACGYLDHALTTAYRLFLVHVCFKCILSSRTGRTVLLPDPWRLSSSLFSLLYKFANILLNVTAVLVHITQVGWRIAAALPQPVLSPSKPDRSKMVRIKTRAS